MIDNRLNSRVAWLLHMMVLIASLVVVANVSYDILTAGIYDPHSHRMLTIQLFVCGIFLLDFFVRMSVSVNKLRFVGRNILLLIFSIPYLNIISHIGLQLPAAEHYLFSLLPLLRSGYGLLIIVRWIYGRSVTTLLAAYLTMLAAMVYFSSLLFFVAEQGVNPSVKHWTDALWWAMMDMNTVGSDIVAVTPIGRILSVILGMAGIMVLPIFTVYITQKMNKRIARDAHTHTTKKEDSKSDTTTLSQP